MAGWSAEDSNLNTTCQACTKVTVPLLNIQITVKIEEKLKQSMKQADTMTVPYLNPLVLRKELENILAAEGDLALTKTSFVDEHPIIYWNLVWFMDRIDVNTHLPNLCLPEKVGFNKLLFIKFDTVFQFQDDENVDPLSNVKSVSIQCVWDNQKLHREPGKYEKLF